MSFVAATTGMDQHLEVLDNQPYYHEERTAGAHLITGSSLDNGTGALSAIGLYLDIGQTTPIVVIIKAPKADVGQTLTVSEIKEAFGLNRSQLAKLIDCSRPQLNKWISGDEPHKDEFRQRISTLSQWASLADKEYLVFFGRLAKRYVNSKETVLDVLGSSNESAVFLEVYNSLKPIIVELSGKMASKADTPNNPHGIEIDLPING